MCKISVVTSVYNCERFIGETIQSIIDQTFQDWEFILIDDCSTDQSVRIMEELAGSDPRIRVIKNEKNAGQCANLNRGIQMARGKYIARLDHDDICREDRLEKQYDYMEQHEDVVLLGSRMSVWENGRVRHDMKGDLPLSSGEARFMEFFGTPFGHSTFFIRKSAMADNNIWYGDYQYAEDYALVADMLRVGEIDKLQEPLVAYRVFPEQTTWRCPVETREGEGEQISTGYLGNLDFNDKDILRKARLGDLKGSSDFNRMRKAFIEYATKCGLGDSLSELSKRRCIRYAYRTVFAWQAGSIGLLKEYVASPLKMRGWLLSWEGLSVIKQCILRKNTRKNG